MNFFFSFCCIEVFRGSCFIKAKVNVFRVCIAWYKHSRAWENSWQLCKTSTLSRVCITVPNCPNSSRGYIRQWRNVFYCLNSPLLKNYWRFKIRNHRLGRGKLVNSIILLMQFVPHACRTSNIRWKSNTSWSFLVQFMWDGFQFKLRSKKSFNW